MSIYSLLMGVSLLLHVSLGTPQKHADFHHTELPNIGGHRPHFRDEIYKPWTTPKEQVCSEALTKLKHIPVDGMLSTEARYVSTDTIQCQVVTQQSIASSEQVHTISQSTLRFLVVPDTGSVEFIN